MYSVIFRHNDELILMERSLELTDSSYESAVIQAKKLTENCFGDAFIVKLEIVEVVGKYSYNKINGESAKDYFFRKIRNTIKNLSSTLDEKL